MSYHELIIEQRLQASMRYWRKKETKSESMLVNFQHDSSTCKIFEKKKKKELCRVQGRRWLAFCFRQKILVMKDYVLPTSLEHNQLS